MISNSFLIWGFISRNQEVFTLYNKDYSNRTFSKYLVLLLFAFFNLSNTSISLADADNRNVSNLLDSQNNQQAHDKVDITGFDRTSISIIKTSNVNRLLIKQNSFQETFVLPAVDDEFPVNFLSRTGKEIIVAQNLSNTIVTIDNKNFEIPNVDANLSTRIHRQLPIKHQPQQSIYISGHKLNEQQKEIIKKAFESIGINRDIRFDEKQITVIQTDKLQLLDNNDPSGIHNKLSIEIK